MLALVLSTAAAVLLAAPAYAKTSQPPVGEYAWYWEDQKRVKDPSGEDNFVFEQPNPYCPGTTLGGVDELCKAGRLPIEVRNGDYKTPNKLAAVGFDLTLVTPESEIEKFKVTFVEARDHHSDTGGFNHERKKLQACRVLEYFGTGEAREYSETPRFRCTKDDPRARHRVVGEGDEQRHQWTFDLTPMARKWMDKGAVVTAIVLRPVDPATERAIGGIEGVCDNDPIDDEKPCKEEEAQGEPHDNWRVVLLGPEERNGTGIETKIVYDPPPLPDPPPPPTTTPPPPSSSPPPQFDSGPDFGTSTTGATTDTTTDTSTTTDDTIASTTPTPEPTPTPTPVEASGEQPVSATGPETPSVVGFPWYMWLALLAGLIGFSMVRSVLLESATGVRPDGVLAQIRKLNAERRGVPAAAAAPAAGTRPGGGLAARARALGALPRRAVGLIGRVRNKRG